MWTIKVAFLLIIVCRTFLSTTILCNTSFLKQSVRSIFSILLEHHISKLSRYFRYTSPSLHVSTPYRFTSFFLKLKANLLVKRLFLYYILQLISIFVWCKYLSVYLIWMVLNGEFYTKLSYFYNNLYIFLFWRCFAATLLLPISAVTGETQHPTRVSVRPLQKLNQNTVLFNIRPI